MIQYTIATPRIHRRELEVQMRLPVPADRNVFTLHLPYWRPGRYERQMYERNISAVTCTDPEVRIERKTTHTWEISAGKTDHITLQYRYYANRLDAGGAFTDEDLVYFNPVNLLLFDPTRPDMPCSMEVNLSPDFEAVCALPRQGHSWFAPTADALMDAPFLASRNMQHHVFTVCDTQMHIWLHGAHTPDFLKLENAFKAFTEAQVRVMGDLPCDDFHFLFLISEGRSYHGVEHPDSTVITLGPAAELMLGQVWNDLLSISSHELFHLWNVKRIRPAEMVPYDYTREQYSRLHDITEGFTTYYGELMLVRPGVWSLDEWLKEMNDILQKHLDAPGKAYTSLTDASFNSWINGYHNEGLAEQKISFYHKGALTAMLLDLRLRQHTQGKHSLDNLMQRLYADYKNPGYTGYTREDIQVHLKAMGFSDADAFYHDFVAGNADVLSALQAILPSFGLQLSAMPGNSFTRHTLGLRIVRNTENKLIVAEVLPGSPAAESSLHPGDMLHTLDNITLNAEDPDADFQYACTLKTELMIHYSTRGLQRTTTVPIPAQRFDSAYAFSALPDADAEALKRREDWLGC